MKDYYTKSQNKKYPKVLFISHHVFSYYNHNGKTFSNIFNKWCKTSLAQLYYSSEYPQEDFCDNYFNLNDTMILKRNKYIGRRYTEKDIMKGEKYISNNTINIHKSIRKRSLSMKVFFKNILWGSHRWNSKNFKSWLEDYKPEVVVAVGGGAISSYIIARHIAKSYNIPVCMYFTDDYFYKSLDGLSIFGQLNYWALEYAMKILLKYISVIFTIGDKMANEYAKKFKKKCIPIMNGIDINRYIITNNTILSGNKTKLKIAYFGGLHLNRWKSIKKLIDAIEKNYCNIKFSLSIYTVDEPNEMILENIHRPPFSYYMGNVSDSKLVSKMNLYDILLHVESFENTIIQKTRLSISTKIPEYLATGKVIFAIGPSNIASIEYLELNKLACICSSDDIHSITKCIKEIYQNYAMYEKNSRNNITIANNNYSLDKNHVLVKEVLTKTVYDWQMEQLCKTKINSKYL